MEKVWYRNFEGQLIKDHKIMAVSLDLCRPTGKFISGDRTWVRQHFGVSILLWLVSMNFLCLLYVYFSINTVGVGAVPSYADGDVRLEDGTTSLDGRVEVYYQGSWGTVCDDYWDDQDAQVVCNQVMPGYHGMHFGSAYFGEGSGSILLDDVQCDGTESSLLDCSHNGVYTHNCLHSEDAGVRCYRPASDGEIQLIGGGAPYRGRVEIFYDRQWGTICDDSWDLQDAAVVCRQLGYTGATNALHRAYFGEGSGPIFLDDLYCTGEESRLVDCQGADFYQHNCRHYEDASVICIAPMDGDVRLGDGTSREGRVEIYLEEEWLPICDSDWTAQDATIACRHLGFSFAENYGTANYGSSTGQVLGVDILCDGDESSLAQCELRDNNCNGEVIVACHAPDDGDLRLQGGVMFYEGRVEVYYQGHWGTVCDDRWDIQDAQVACTQLGFSGAVEAVSMAYFGQGEGNIHLDEVECVGSEFRLADCQHWPWTQHDCSHYEDASVVCEHHEIGNIRLVDGDNDREGRVEIWIDDRGWMTFCDQGWDEDEGEVVCRQLGFEGLVQVTNRSSFGGGTGDVFGTNLGCTGQDSTILDCNRDEDTTLCTHSEDAGVICAFPEGETRLVDGASEAEGRVEIFHDNKWWTVCGHWSDTEARALCHELGFTGVALSNHFFGPGSGDQVEDIFCSEYSATLRDCTVGSNYQSTTACTHSDDVGVVCDDTKFVSGSVRLVNSNVPEAGRVEMFTGERWGSVCDVAFDIEDAHVVCRQVGYKRATFAKTGAFFGRNSYRVVSVGHDCHGTELTLHECPLAHGTRLSECTHDHDSGVICDPVLYTDYSVELVGNATYQSSRVSIFHEGQWKSACSDNWDWRAAQVTCRQVGYVGASHIVDENEFVDFRPLVFTAHDIECGGSEYHLSYCSADWTSRTCNSNKVASVRCATSYEDVLRDGDIRLYNGTSSKNGQVEMFDEGEWLPVCGDDWGWEEATVACRELGYLGAISAYTMMAVDAGTDFIWSGLECEGYEYRLQDCNIPSNGWDTTADCQRVGGAECALSLALLHQNGDVRLIGGEDSGIVAFFYRGIWGKVCPHNWSWSLANRACFMLGYLGAVEATSVPNTDYDVDFHIHSLISCDEFNLRYCDFNTAWEIEVECDSDSNLAAGVVCTHEYQDVPYHGKARLVNGPDIGHVEVFLDDAWGLVCGDTWSIEDATVVCRNLGYHGVIKYSSLPMNGTESRAIVMNGVRCGGYESYLTDCSYTVNGYCQSMAYTECSMESDELAMQVPIMIRLSGGKTEKEGRVEVFVLGQWRSLCDETWTGNDAAVVCRHLGFEDGMHREIQGGHYGYSSFGSVRGYPICSGWEESLDQCYLQTPFYQCWNYDVGLNCDVDDSVPVIAIVVIVAVFIFVIVIIIVICSCYHCFCKAKPPQPAVAPGPISDTMPGAAPNAVTGVPLPENAPLPFPPVMTQGGLPPNPALLPNVQYTTLPSMDDLTLPTGAAAPLPPKMAYVPAPIPH